MSIFEKQTVLSKSLYEINTNTVKELVGLQRDNIQKYFETNKDFGSRVSEVTDINTFVSLQKEYGQTLWSNAKGAVEAQNGIVKGAFVDSKDAFKSAFQNETSEVVAEETTVETATPEASEKAKPKAKAKAKKATTAKAA